MRIPVSLLVWGGTRTKTEPQPRHTKCALAASSLRSSALLGQLRHTLVSTRFTSGELATTISVTLRVWLHLQVTLGTCRSSGFRRFETAGKLRSALMSGTRPARSLLVAEAFFDVGVAFIIGDVLVVDHLLKL